MEEDGSSKYPGNKIINPNGADAVGIFPSRTSDVPWSNTAKGQGSSGGTKQEGDGHSLGNIKYNISDNTITALNGESDVGMFSFHNIGFYWRNALKPKGGSSSAQGQGGGGGTKPKGDDYNICGNDIKGDGDRKAFHNFSNIEYNLKTTNTEDDASTSEANILKNTITASNGASYVGMFNFHNVDVWSNAGQDQGGRQGNKGFPKLKRICHNICNNKISAYNCTNVGFQNFGNIRYNKAGDGLRKDEAGSSSAKEGKSKKPWYKFGKNK